MFPFCWHVILCFSTQLFAQANCFNFSVPNLPFWPILAPPKVGVCHLVGSSAGGPPRRMYAAGAEFSEDLKDLGQASWAVSDILEAGPEGCP